MQLTNEFRHLPVWSRPRYADFGSWNPSFVCYCFMHGFCNPFLHLLMLHAWVLEPILSFINAACTSFGIHSFVCCRCMHRFCLASTTDDILTFQMGPLHVSFVISKCPCLQSMSSRGINCYRIPVGCPVAASPPRMQAKMSRDILLMRDSADEESRWRLIGMVSETLLLDL